MNVLRAERPPRRIALLTDFGCGSAYVGQMRLRLAAMAPTTPVIDLISDLPICRPELAAYLLPGLAQGMPPGTVYLCVVDPGVGSARGVLCARHGRDWWLGPDNGLLEPLVRQRGVDALWRIDWRPPRTSASFHGRDLFAPLAAALIAGRLPGARPCRPADLVGADWPVERAAVIYIDAFGNLITGLRADGRAPQAMLVAGTTHLRNARTFSSVARGQAFWYYNALGYIEVAVNQGRADRTLGVGLGDPVTFV